MPCRTPLETTQISAASVELLVWNCCCCHHRAPHHSHLTYGTQLKKKSMYWACWLDFCISILNYNCTHRCMCWCMRVYNIYIYMCVCRYGGREREREREPKNLQFQPRPPISSPIAPWLGVIERCFRCNQTFSWQGSGISFPAGLWFHGYLWINGVVRGTR